jgi:predicted alpha/beta hydrolase
MTAAITALAIQYGRYGYRRITAMLRERGWRVACCRFRGHREKVFHEAGGV